MSLLIIRQAFLISRYADILVRISLGARTSCPHVFGTRTSLSAHAFDLNQSLQDAGVPGVPGVVQEPSLAHSSRSYDYNLESQLNYKCSTASFNSIKRCRQWYYQLVTLYLCPFFFLSLLKLSTHCVCTVQTL